MPDALGDQDNIAVQEFGIRAREIPGLVSALYRGDPLGGKLAAIPVGVFD